MSRQVAAGTPAKRKPRPPQTARLSKIDKRIDDLESAILVHRNELRRLQEQISQVEVSSRLPRMTPRKTRFTVPLAGAGLAVLALFAVSPLLRSRPEVQQVASAQAPAVQEPGPAAPVEVKVQDAVLHQVLPDVPQSAKDTIRGTVKFAVRASVDSSGNVTEAVFDSPGPSRYFADLAMEAARAWKFTMIPAKGRTAPREWMLLFEFGNETTNALAEPAPR